MSCNCFGSCSCGCIDEQPINVIEQAVNDALAGRIDELNGYTDSAKDSADAAKVSEINAEGYAEESKGFRDQTEIIYQNAQALVPEILEASQNVEDAAIAVQNAVEIASSVAIVRYPYTVVGGEYTIVVPNTYDARTVQSIDVEGFRQYPGYGYTYDAATQTVTMDQAFDTEQAGTVVMLFLGTLNADSPETVYSNFASTSGASMIGTSSGNTVQEELDATQDKIENDIAELKSSLFVASIKDMLALTPQNIHVTVTGYIPGTDFGGGLLYWDSTKQKANHNGITIFSPTVPWDGSYSNLEAFLAGIGETNTNGTGCWVRSNKGDIMASWSGFDVTGNQIADVSIKAAATLAASTRRCLRIDPGSKVKCGFTRLTQYHDKFNLNLQTSVVLSGITGLTIYAKNDVEFVTDHATYRERVVFGLFNHKNVTISGFNWNSNFTDYSTKPTDTSHKIQEHWKGVASEGGDNLILRDNNVNACHVFVMADSTNLTADLQNKHVKLISNRFKYVVNYCVITRNIDWLTFDNNDVSYQGRAWHTFGEAVAPTSFTKHIRVCDNKFTDQIAVQSCITPGPHIESGLISRNYCKRSNGIFIENGSTSNLLITNNVSISTGERLSDGTADGVHGTTHILLVGEVDDQPVGASPHSNILIQGNRFEGGGYAVQEYNTGIELRYGFQIKDNQMIDCIPPIIQNQSFIGIEVSGNYIKAPTDFPNLSIAGQHPVIDNNILIGVRVHARDLGYTIVSPKVTNNTFRANSVGSVFPALVDYTDFSGLVAESNNVVDASFTDFVVHPSNANTAGFKRLGVTEGFTVSPFERFGSKLTCKAGDMVMNSGPASTNNKYAWICVDGSAKTFGSLILAI